MENKSIRLGSDYQLLECSLRRNTNPRTPWTSALERKISNHGTATSRCQRKIAEITGRGMASAHVGLNQREASTSPSPINCTSANKLTITRNALRLSRRHVEAHQSTSVTINRTIRVEMKLIGLAEGPSRS